jgi:hypothetical protein
VTPVCPRRRPPHYPNTTCDAANNKIAGVESRPRPSFSSSEDNQIENESENENESESENESENENENEEEPNRNNTAEDHTLIRAIYYLLLSA